MPRHRVSPSASPMRGSGGASSTPRPLGSITGVSGILDHPPQCAIAHKAGDDEQKRSRGAFCPRFTNSLPLLEVEGAGNAGCALHPRSRVPNCATKGAHEHTGQRRQLRHPLRNGFTAYIVLSPVSGLVVTVTCGKHRKLGASIAAPGPHDFAVRPGVFVRRENHA
jgi:hypothetical protein